MTSVPSIGHNSGTADESRQQSIRTRWAKALFDDKDTPSYVIAMAWVIHWYTARDGSGAAISNQQFQDMCGISQPTATRGKRWLRDNGYVQLKVGKGDEKTRFQITLPERPADDGVITQTTQQETTQPQMTRGHHTDHPGVICGLQHIQERDSGYIQDNRRAAAKPKNGNDFWKQALNPQEHGSVSFENGKLTLLNGTRAEWLQRFEGDETRLDLALIQIASFLQPNSGRPLKTQVSSQLARIAGEKHDRDARYAHAARANKPPPAGKAKPSRW